MITYIITTFLRDNLLYKSVESLLPYLGDNAVIIVDQGHLTEEKISWLDKHDFDAINYSRQNNPQKRFYYQVPFNKGLSWCRNYGVKKAKELSSESVFIGSDSFIFNENIQKLDIKNTNYDIIGVDLRPSVCWWEAKLNLIEGVAFELDFIDKNNSIGLNYPFFTVYDVEICRNCFIAKTDILLNTTWDENLLLGEHEDMFWRLKQAGVKVGWTPTIVLEKQTDRPSEYLKYRTKNFNDGRKKLKEKYSITGWVKYKNLDRAKEQN
jgi:glycosyltransferase involved in cell wall biosynthesis